MKVAALLFAANFTVRKQNFMGIASRKVFADGDRYRFGWFACAAGA